ncbi:gamma-glutamylcyclotransferase family protein [Kitasatospora sp. LaBMicrA B282]|uniref:gamma-glutamylcyclotransferase family protein n=1 Tax=Kitasatospora sp. LaBMicrA B282 TaxID=3420949 RepID=UPI003D121E19
MTDDAALPFFVYGTLRRGQRNHGRYLHGHCERVEPAELAGAALYEGPGYPYAVADPDPGRRVRGELVTVRAGDFAQVLAELDELEGCRPDGRGLYVRRPLPVTASLAAPGTARVTAWVYLAGPDLTTRLRATDPVLIPSGDWTAR